MRNALGIPRRRWKDNIKTNIKERDCEQWGVSVKTVMSLRVPQGGEFLE
jgi:hypothetical protein